MMNGTFPGGEIEGELAEGGYEELGVIERTERSIRVRRSEDEGRACKLITHHLFLFYNDVKFLVDGQYFEVKL